MSEAPLGVLNLCLQAPKLNYEQATERSYGMQGVLLKESPNLFGGWDERYCVLKGQRFVYKEDCHPTSPNAGILNFHLLSCQLFLHKDGSVCEYFTYILPHAASLSPTPTNTSYSRHRPQKKQLNGCED